jgi:hypothetical protein
MPVAMAIAGRAPQRPAGRLFYPGAAIVIGVLVLIGFGPTFYVRGAVALPDSVSPLSPILLVHGVVSTLWIAVFVAQTWLVARGRTDLHRRLGLFGALVAIAMIVVGTATTLDGLWRQRTLFGIDPRVWWLGNTFTGVIMFTALVGAGFAFRRRPAVHKRLMLLATITAMSPAIPRLVLFVFGLDPSWILVTTQSTTVAFLVAAMLHDLWTERRVHPVLVWGGLGSHLFPMVMLNAVANTGAGLAFADLFL